MGDFERTVALINASFGGGEFTVIRRMMILGGVLLLHLVAFLAARIMPRWFSSGNFRWACRLFGDRRVFSLSIIWAKFVMTGVYGVRDIVLWRGARRPPSIKDRGRAYLTILSVAT